ncbi:MAG: hypothetical protein JSV49_07615 [Thermoplasmata archaeon]|nr:MAG: hypothetical protein JSV49_07615 [Thermoplasmata archaeon]
MSKNHRFRRTNQKAIIVLDELVAVGLVIILFSASTVILTTYIELYHKNSDLNDLYQEAVEIAIQIQSHEKLIYRGQAAVFDINKLNELDARELEQIAAVPEDHGLGIEIEDISTGRKILSITLTAQSSVEHNGYGMDRAEFYTPVNLHINDLEVHAAKLTVNLWHRGE